MGLCLTPDMSQMTSTGWAPLAEISSQVLKGGAATLATAGVQIAYRYFCPTCQDMLNICKSDLEEAKTRFDELTQEERERISIVAQQKDISTLEKLERDLRR